MTDAVVDVGEYLTRIGYDGSTQPTEDLLHALVAAHGRTIPFENLDPLFGVPVDDLGAARARRQARTTGAAAATATSTTVSMGYVLERARVRRRPDRRPGGVDARARTAPLPAMTHQVLAVTVPGEDDRFLVDVGFGGQTLSSPIRLIAGPGTADPPRAATGSSTAART